MARTIALDVGDRRIGVAVSDVTKLIARPLCVIDRKRGDPIERIIALVAEHGADEIVVGLPLHADGNVSEQARQVQNFVEVLVACLDVPIRWVDERYTTQDARQILTEIRRRRQPQHDDAIAAAVILQRYLDEAAGDRSAADGS